MSLSSARNYSFSQTSTLLTATFQIPNTTSSSITLTLRPPSNLTSPPITIPIDVSITIGYSSTNPYTNFLSTNPYSSLISINIYELVISRTFTFNIRSKYIALNKILITGPINPAYDPNFPISYNLLNYLNSLIPIRTSDSLVFQMNSVTTTSKVSYSDSLTHWDSSYSGTTSNNCNSWTISSTSPYTMTFPVNINPTNCLFTLTLTFPNQVMSYYNFVLYTPSAILKTIDNSLTSGIISTSSSTNNYYDFSTSTSYSNLNFSKITISISNNSIAPVTSLSNTGKITWANTFSISPVSPFPWNNPFQSYFYLTKAANINITVN